MQFQTPRIYTQSGDIGEFEGFDRLYEQENMPNLIANGWPVNWNYVTKDK